MNRPKPSADEINQRRNFDSVLKNSLKPGSKPLIKKPWFLSSVMVTAAVIIATVMVLNKKDNKAPIVKSEQIIDADSLKLTEFYKAEEAKSCIAPPIKGLNIPYTVYKVIAEKGGTLDFKTGSKLSIPKNAFVDASGKPVKGEVELRYREFHDAADFFVSGIPMTYDSAGVKYQFESAGMMEMLAFKDGQQVNMAPQKSVNIELASEYKGSEYNLYKLDTMKNNWSCLGKDKVVSSATPAIGKADSVIQPVIVQQTPEYKSLEVKKEEAKVVKEEQIAALPKPGEEPKKPARLNKAKYTVNLDIDLKDFPEFKVYKDVQWEIGDENKNMNEAVFNGILKTGWEDIILKEGPKKGENYLMTLKKGTKKVEDLVVYPVFEGKGYQVAMTEFQNKFSKYTTALDKRKADELKIEQEYLAKIEELKKREAELEAKWKREMDSKIAKMSTEEKVLRVFTISSFGVFNCDNPSVYPTGVRCSATLANEKNVKLMCYDVCLVDKHRNGLFTFYKNPVTAFSFDPKSTNMLWTVENGVLYYLKPEGFSKIKSGEGIINLSKVDQQFKTVDEMKAFFNL